MTSPQQRLLSGPDWRIKPYLAEDWLMRREHLPGTPEVPPWIPAVVPGSIQRDHWQSAELSNPSVSHHPSVSTMPASASVGGAVFALDLALPVSSLVVAANRYFYSRSATLEPRLDLEQVSLKAALEKSGPVWTVLVRNVGAHVALFIWLEDARPPDEGGYHYCDDNYFSLFPGEGRTIRLEWDNVAPASRRLRLAGSNTSVTPF